MPSPLTSFLPLEVRGAGPATNGMTLWSVSHSVFTSLAGKKELTRQGRTRKRRRRGLRICLN